MAQGIMDYVARLLHRNGEEGSGLKAQQIRKIGWLVLIGLVGVLLLIIGFSPRLQGPARTPDETTPQTTGGASPVGGGLVTTAAGSAEVNESYLERTLEGILSQVEGAGRVSVKLTFSTGRTYEYAQNATSEESSTTEHDSGGVRRETTEVRTSGEVVTTQERGTGYAVPVVRTVLEPRVQGVLVVSDGARDPSVRTALTEAVATVLDVPPHKVAVLPRER